MLIGLQGRKVKAAEVPPRNLVFLIDVSGSMRSRDKLPLMQRSLVRLLKGLTDKDTVAIVTYAGRESVALEPTNCRDKAPIQRCIEGLGAGGSTNGAGGIQKAYELARQSFHKEHVNRVILVTDGDFNVGVSNTKDLQALIEKERESGVYLTVVGVGTGNLRDDNMSTLAKHGNGQYLYLDSDAEAKRVFEYGLTGMLVPIAKDVKLQVEFNPQRVAGYRLIGYERRVMAKKDFRDDKKDSGEVGSGHSVTALYEVVPPGVAVPGATSVADAPSSGAQREELMEVRLRYKQPWAKTAKESSFRMAPDTKSGGNLPFASAVAAFGLVMSKSAHGKDATFALATELAASCVGKSKVRAEFLRLVKTAHGARRHQDAVAKRGARPAGIGLPPEVKALQTERRPDIRKSLDWLRAQQRGDGSFVDSNKTPVGDVGTTGLAVLAMLGDGNTMRSGPMKDHVKSAVKWLRQQQKADGLYTSASSDGSLLDHVIAALAMTEAAGLSQYKTLRRNVYRGRDYLIGKQASGSVQTLGWQVLLWESLARYGWVKEAGELRLAGPKILQQPKHKASHVFDHAPIVLIEKMVLRGEGLKPNEPVPPQADRILAFDPSKLDELDAAGFFFGARAIDEVGGTHRATWNKDNWAAIRTAQNKDGTFGGKSTVYDTALVTLALAEPFFGSR